MKLNDFPWVFTIFAVLTAFIYFKIGPGKPFLTGLMVMFTVREGLTLDQWKSLTYSSAFLRFLRGISCQCSL